MPSAKMDPDQVHALETLWRKWVFPPSGIDRLSHYILSALPKFVGLGTLPRPDLYAAIGSL
jgi:hypothetical protein